MQVINQQTRGDAWLDLVLTNKKEVVEDGSFGCSDHEIVKFNVLR